MLVSKIVFSGMNPDEIKTAKDKIDFKLSKLMLLDTPLYCKAQSSKTPQLRMRTRKRKMEQMRVNRMKTWRMKKSQRKKKLCPTKAWR